ncbi:MAG: hypothetical protein ACLT8Y_02085 [Dorea formicigenerans]
MGTVAIEEVTGRIAENLECLKRFTATPGDGCTRLPFTKEARDAVNYLREVMTEAGLEVHEDEYRKCNRYLKRRESRPSMCYDGISL